jgi:hypothetical protein
MSIGTYAQLQAAIGSWTHRADLSSQYANFISLTEARLTRVLQAREPEVEEELTATVGSRYIALPSGFKRPIALWLTTETPRLPMTLRRPEQIEFAGETGSPLAWAIDGANIALDVLAASAYTFDFRYQQAFALSDENTTNYVLTEYPDVYLWGSLVEAARYTKNQKDLATFEASFQKALKEAADLESDVRDAPLLTEFGYPRSDITRGY